MNGNIISIDQDEKKTRYFYDSCNRLIREDNPDFKRTYVYQYDKAGNLLLKKEYGYHMASSELQEEPTVTEYVYDCENRDRLIAFNKKAFVYDKMGRPTTYKGDKFVWNYQGQLIGIKDNIKYFYDAYGNHKVEIPEYVTSSIAELNPFRYRGYFWDEETHLYYLNARYYDPETGRFISPDTLSILDETRGQINGLNLYMYCGDNPIMHVDPSGCFFLVVFLTSIAIGAVVGAVAGGVTAAAQDQNVLTGILAGFAIGGLIGLGVGLGAGLIGAGAMAVVSSAANGIFGAVAGAVGIAMGYAAVGATMYGIVANTVKIAHSYNMVNKYGDLDYSSISLDGNSVDTDLLNNDETIMRYVNYLYSKEEIQKNWTKAQLYRELKYHRLAKENNLLNSLFERNLRQADVETVQKFRAYFYRFFGNMLF